jgi:hypothetical protein
MRAILGDQRDPVAESEFGESQFYLRAGAWMGPSGCISDDKTREGQGMELGGAPKVKLV